MQQQSFDVMSALAQPTRWRAFEVLVATGRKGMIQGEIAEALGVSKNLLSVHLKVLQVAGLVSAERNGREVTYRANPDMVRTTGQALLDSVKKTRRTAPD